MSNGVANCFRQLPCSRGALPTGAMGIRAFVICLLGKPQSLFSKTVTLSYPNEAIHVHYQILPQTPDLVWLIFFCDDIYPEFLKTPILFSATRAAGWLRGRPPAWGLFPDSLCLRSPSSLTIFTDLQRKEGRKEGSGGKA